MCHPEFRVLQLKSAVNSVVSGIQTAMGNVYSAVSEVAAIREMFIGRTVSLCRGGHCSDHYSDMLPCRVSHSFKIRATMG